ncbi:MAG: hypothetical protein ABIE84_05850 [bacterium]
MNGLTDSRAEVLLRKVSDLRYFGETRRFYFADLAALFGTVDALTSIDLDQLQAIYDLREICTGAINKPGIRIVMPDSDILVDEAPAFEILAFAAGHQEFGDTPVHDLVDFGMSATKLEGARSISLLAVCQAGLKVLTSS